MGRALDTHLVRIPQSISLLTGTACHGAIFVRAGNAIGRAGTTDVRVTAVTGGACRTDEDLQGFIISAGVTVVRTGYRLGKNRDLMIIHLRVWNCNILICFLQMFALGFLLHGSKI